MPWLCRVTVCLFACGLTLPAALAAESRPEPSSAKATVLGDPSSKATGTYNTALTAPSRAHVTENYGKLPLSFEANHGQAHSSVRFLSRGKGYTLFLNPTEVVLALSKPTPAGSARSLKHGSPPATRSSSLIEMKLAGANARANILGVDELPGRSNYFIGSDPKQWHINVPTYKKVAYREIYPGIDLIYYGNQRQLEYDFVLSPGADPSQIRLEVAGARKLHLDDQKNLIVESNGGEIQLKAPLAYQEFGGTKHEVASRWVLTGKNAATFELAKYNRDKTLTIDPSLVYSTYLGGTNTELGEGIAVDGLGNAYVTGITYSVDFPTANAFQQGCTVGCDVGLSDVFVSKLNPSGDALVYSTYIGGSSLDFGIDIALDQAGNAYVTGETLSTDFPTVNALQSTCGGGCSTGTDAFVVKLNSAGTGLIYSTYFGGSQTEAGFGVSIDSVGNAYIAGQTNSTDLPTANAFQPQFAGGNTDVFIARLNAAGSALTYSTYLGGLGDDFADDIAVDSADNAYLAGGTTSTNFPTLNAVQAGFGGTEDAFVTKLNSAGVPSFSTYLGGAQEEVAIGVTVDGPGNAYVVGETFSADFPTANALQRACGLDVDNACTEDAFVAKFSPTGALTYSTYLGGNGADVGIDIAVDSSANVLVTGQTSSTDFPVSNAVQTVNLGATDAFVTTLNASGTGFLYSTYLGGQGFEQSVAIGVDPTGNAYIAGVTQSSDFPTVSPLPAPNNQLQGGQDAFVAKLAFVPAPSCQTTISKIGLTIRASVVCTSGDFSNGGNLIIFWGDGSQDSSDGTPPPFSANHTYSASGQYRVITEATDATDLISSVFQTVDVSNAVTVAVVAASPTVLAGTTDNFTATVTGATDTSVTWSTSGGTISSSGLLTAPAATGFLTVTAKANADNQTTGSANVQVTDFRVGSGAVVVISQGTTSANTTATLTSAGFAGAETLSCSNLPAGANCTFSPPTVNLAANGTATSIFAISASLTVTPGVYPFSVAATDGATGAQRLGAFTLEVQAEPCAFSLNPTSQSVAANGGSVTVAVTASCAWTATSNDGFIIISSGTAGTTSGAVIFTVGPNTSASPRTGTLTIAGISFTVTQAGSVGVTVSPVPVSVQAGGSQRFSTVENVPVTWSLSGQGCNGGPCGTIDQTGLYTAPAIITSAAVDTVTAISQTDPTKSASVEVLLFSPPVIPNPPPEQSVTAGQPATFSFTVLPNTGDLHEATKLICKQELLPSGVNCVFTPSTVTFGSSPTTFQLTVVTTGQSGMLSPMPVPGARSFLYASLLPFSGIVLLGLTSKRRKWLGITVVATLCVLLLFQGGCATTGTFGTPPPTTAFSATPAGTYTIVIQGLPVVAGQTGVGSAFTIATVTLAVH